LIALVESLHHTTARFAKSTIATMESADPRIECGVLVDYTARVVGGTIVYDDPLNGKNVLAKHAPESEREVCFFVPDRSDDDIFGRKGTYFTPGALRLFQQFCGLRKVSHN
jgi:hypothetical protein